MGVSEAALRCNATTRWLRSVLGAAWAWAVMSALAAWSASAPADAGVDCDAINSGVLNVELGPAARSAEREVTLDVGDTLTFAARRSLGASVALTLRAGDGTWQTLPVGRASTNSAMVAPGEGTFTVRVTFGGRGTAAVAVTCVPSEIAEDPDLQAGDRSLPSPTSASKDAPAGIAFATNGIAGVQATGGLAFKIEKREAEITASGLDLGVSYKLFPSIVVGALAQFDQSTAQVAGLPLSISDRAWMAGPTTTVHVGPGLALDMRAAWGKAEAGALEFEPGVSMAERRLLSARLANTQEFGALKLTPSISFNHMQETQHPVLPSPAEVAMTQAAVVGSGRVDFGPELAYRLDLANAAFIEPKAAVGGFWGFDSLTKLAPGAMHGDMRLKAEAGVTFGVTDGAKVQAGAAVEEGSGTAPDTWTGRLQLSIPLK